MFTNAFVCCDVMAFFKMCFKDVPIIGLKVAITRKTLKNNSFRAITKADI